MNIVTALIEATGVFSEYSDYYIAGQALDRPAPTTHWNQLAKLPLALLAIAVKFGPILLPAGIASALLVACGMWVVRRRWPNWRLRRPATVLGLGGRLFVLVGVAYGLGCFVHWLVPAAWFNPPAVPPGLEVAMWEDYLWPYFEGDLPPEMEGGWTIYAPGFSDVLGYSVMKASSIKLSSLLVVLLFYRYRRRGHTPATTTPVAPA